MREFWEVTKEEELEMAQTNRVETEWVDFFSEEAKEFFL